MHERLLKQVLVNSYGMIFYQRVVLEACGSRGRGVTPQYISYKPKEMSLFACLDAWKFTSNMSLIHTCKSGNFCWFITDILWFHTSSKASTGFKSDPLVKAHSIAISQNLFQ